ncbi:MAG: fused MFS/spermidine synthase [Rhodobiaceae bacterium]|nr:fused MFS/spermidine synthase [Rhodobiaceae bacterium]
MSDVGLHPIASVAAPRETTLALTLPVFAATLFLSAFLLFGVQPMFTKMVLPQLGGSPSVWSVAMCFFQGALLLGYAYAHFLTARLPLRAAVGIHLVVLAIAFASLPITIAAGWGEPPAQGTSLWLVGLFSVSVGLPFFAVAGNAPLLQAWFSRTGHAHAGDPYFLYGASNVGSLLALLAYPVVVEPSLTLAAQSMAWKIGFGVLGLLVVACALVVLARVRALSAAADLTADEPAGAAPTARDRAVWVGLAFVPSALLVAVTAHISTDVAAAPFLWVIPLALFLLTFIITFQRRPVLPHALMLKVQPFVMAPLAVSAIFIAPQSWFAALALALTAFFVSTMVAHGELVRRRPASGHLTEFYLWMSVGGVLGGSFAGLAAPHMFNTVLEYPILLALCLVCRPGVFGRTAGTYLMYGALAAGMVALAALPGMFGIDMLNDYPQVRAIILVTLAGVMMLARSDAARLAFLFVGALGVNAMLSPATMAGSTHRSFFGVHRVAETPDGTFRLLFHGTTLHGAQRIRTPQGDVVREGPPTTYYAFGGPFDDVVRAARATHGGTLGKVGVVGLGAGSLACHRHAGETWRFYEIDPIVVDIARNPANFRFLSDCAPDAAIVVGDARLTLAREAKDTFDLLVIDAFSSDAIPVHLMTGEAMSLYVDRLAPGGMLMMHISNRNLELASVVEANARASGLVAVERIGSATDADVDDDLAAKAHVIAMARTRQDLGILATDKDWHPVDAMPGVTSWTDDYSNIIGAIVRRATRPATTGIE